MSDRKCTYRLSSGSFCKRWASASSQFCHHHEGSTAYFQQSESGELHPLARLTTPEDIFDMLREALNATRLGRMSSGQAHAIGHLAAEWRKTYELLSFRQREMNLHRQFLTDVMVDDKELEAERAEAPHPLPVAIDERANVNQPNPNARPLEPIDSYPGWKERYGQRRTDRPGATDLPVPVATIPPESSSIPGPNQPSTAAFPVPPVPPFVDTSDQPPATEDAFAACASPAVAHPNPNGHQPLDPPRRL